MLALGNASIVTQFNRVSGRNFQRRIYELVEHSSFYGDNLTLYPTYERMECWLRDDSSCGFALSPDHELINVFSTLRGNGRDAVRFAVGLRPYLHLNCYAGVLERMYSEFGFVTQRCDKNWLPDKPDVVYMSYGRCP